MAYPLVVFPLRLRTLDVSAPVKPVATVRFSFLSDACATNWTWLAVRLDDGRTATMTGKVKGTPGRTAAGGVISNVTPYSRPELSGL